MARPANLKIDGAKLDEAIKKAEGIKFNQSKVSQFIMGRDKTYYSGTIKKNEINAEVLDRVCDYYELDKNDYIITEATEKKQIQEKADTQNYDNMILLLTSIDKTLKELLASEKSTQFILNEMKNNLMKSNTNEKNILDKLDDVAKSNTAKANTYNKFRA